MPLPPPAAALLEKPAEPVRRNARLWGLLVGLVVVVAACTAALTWGLAWLLGGGAALAAAVAGGVSAVVMAPLVWALLHLVRELDRSRSQLARLDTLDPLTGVANREHFIALAEREWTRARRYGTGAALLLVDVDRFQRIPDTLGAAAGDQVLLALARHTEPTLRGADALARFGGAQMAVWLAHADPLGALDVAERIREGIEGLPIPQPHGDLHVTVSVGVAALRPAHQNLAALIEDAEAALQAAKAAGGNCVRAAPVDLYRGRTIGPSVDDNQAAGPV
ncbi:MAG: GGDEF domain-containing protein [Rubrivivax sp.]